MEPPFYHVDRGGHLSVGDTLELNWDLKIYGLGEYRALNSQYEGQMRKDFSRGLSSHGSRYVHSFYEIEYNQEYYTKNPYTGIPTPVVGGEHHCVLIENGINEWLVERIRRNSFPDQRSRLTSFFAWPSEGIIDNFGDEVHSVFEVVPAGFDFRDMTLLDQSDGMRHYWEGNLTPQPKLEVVMEPPVEVVDVL